MTGLRVCAVVFALALATTYIIGRLLLEAGASPLNLARFALAAFIAGMMTIAVYDRLEER